MVYIKKRELYHINFLTNGNILTLFDKLLRMIIHFRSE